jgi:hypothetical protein
MWHTDKCFICGDYAHEKRSCFKCLGDIISIGKPEMYKIDRMILYTSRESNSSYSEKCNFCNCVLFTYGIIACDEHYVFGSSDTERINYHLQN